MSNFLESFFDDNQSSFKLWSKKTDEIKLDKEVKIFQGPLHKLSRKNTKWKERFFVLTNKHLIYYRDETESKIRGVMKLQWVRNEYLTEGHPSNKNYKFGVRFIKNMKYSDLWLKEEGDFKKWKDALSQVCLQSDFHSKFSAIKMIGKGSFARVYLVEEKEKKTRFAVKAFSKDYLLSQNKGKESLINEIEVMRELKHPHIMLLEEVHESQNSIYLVMELLEGGELFNYVSEKGNLVPKEYYRVMKCLLEALAYMDNRKIMHRDLKPENMILKDKVNKGKLDLCNLKVVDFGLATRYDAKEYLFKRCGTPGFVAPEVINAPSNENIHYTALCDVFSAGIIFFLLLTGKSPFEGKSFQEILNKNKQCKIDFSHKALKRVSTSAFDLLKKMLETDPTKRPSAVDCLSHDFFIENDVPTTDLGPDANNISADIKTFQEKYKFNVKSIKGGKQPAQQVVNDSIEFRQPAINGKIDTVNDSVDFNNSKGNIYSLHNVKAGGKGAPGPSKPEAKRESIYKHALLQHATILQTEDNSESDEGQDKEKDNTPNSMKAKKSTLNPVQPEAIDGKRKSQFGQK